MIGRSVKKLAEATPLATGNWIAVLVLVAVIGFVVGWVSAYYRLVTGCFPIV